MESRKIKHNWSAVLEARCLFSPSINLRVMWLKNAWLMLQDKNVLYWLKKSAASTTSECNLTRNTLTRIVIQCYWSKKWYIFILFFSVRWTLWWRISMPTTSYRKWLMLRNQRNARYWCIRFVRIWEVYASTLTANTLSSNWRSFSWKLPRQWEWQQQHQVRRQTAEAAISVLSGRPHPQRPVKSRRLANHRRKFYKHAHGASIFVVEKKTITQRRGKQNHNLHTCRILYFILAISVVSIE